MENDYDFSSLHGSDYQDLARDLLNRSIGLNLETIYDTEKHADLWQVGENGQVEVIVEVKSNENITAAIATNLNKEHLKYLSKYEPNKFILVVFSKINITAYSILSSSYQELTNVRIEIYQIDWIQDQLDKYPDLVAKYNIKPPIGVESNEEVELGNIDYSNKQIEELISSERNFYACGHYWGDDDHMERFLKDSIWENGHDEKLIRVVNRVKVGDVVFLKSTFKKGGQGTLRIKAIGVVANNPRDGHKLYVNWNPTVNIDLLGLGGTMSAINQIGKNNVKKVLEGLYEKLPEMLSIIKKLDESKNIDNDYKIDLDLKSKQYWWINASNKYLEEDSIRTGVTQTFIPRDKNKLRDQVFELLLKANTGDLGVIVQRDGDRKTIAIFEITQDIRNKSQDKISFEIKDQFKDHEKFTYEQLKTFAYFKQSKVVLDNNSQIVYQLTEDEFIEVISKYSKTENSGLKKSSLTKTGLNNDGAYTDIDLLDIENDVRSFALILASEDIKPPLAVALFGTWGSGKSFFMEHLSKRVKELSENQGFLESGEPNITSDKIGDNKPFCKGIAQIKFNAWSYLDANLWAGLVSTIFEKLDEYISSKSKGDDEKLELRKQLSEKLEILSSEKKLVKNEKTSLKTEKETLETELLELNSSRDEIIQNIADKKLSDIIEGITRKSELEGSIKGDLKKYGITNERINNLSPNELYKEVNSWVTFLKNLWVLSWGYKISFAIAAIILLIVWIDPNQIASNFFDQIGREITAVISIAGPLFVKIFSTFSKYKKIAEPIIDYKNKFNNNLKEAMFQYEQEKELLEINIQTKQTEISKAESKIIDIENQIDDLDYTLNNFVAKRAFNNFIKRKINNKEYEEHLGLVSIIRKDFETLSNLFQETKIDTTATEEIQIEQKEKQEEHEEIVKLFKEDKVLDRIILYIDDLDRCSDEKVLEVIQAVHLLMAFPLFNVVVGVDIRCLKNALIYKNLLQYSKFTTLEKVKDEGIHVISPDEYLEKIFQIPFQLNDPNEELIKGMVNTFLKDPIEEELPEQTEIQPEQLHSIVTSKEESSAEEEGKDAREESPPKTDKEEIEKKRVITPEDLRLSGEEVELLKEIAWLVGSIPRTIKRFINIYRIIRSHQSLEYDSDNKRKEFLSIMFILAINIGQYKKYAAKIITCIEEDKDKRLTDIFDHKDLKKLKDYKDLNEIRLKLGKIETIKELLQFKDSQFNKHIPFVGRFSFGNVENGNSNNSKKE